MVSLLEVEVDGLAPALKPENVGFFVLGIGGFEATSLAGLLTGFAVALSDTEDCFVTGLGTGIAVVGVGAPAPLFHTLLTSDFADERKPKREVAPFCAFSANPEYSSETPVLEEIQEEKKKLTIC